MIAALVDWSLRNRFLVASAVLVVIAWGVWAMRQVPIDAIPDLSENQVIVVSEWMGRDPQQVEDHVTRPLSVNLQGLADVRAVRGTSMFGMSLVTVLFEDGVASNVARGRVLERLSALGNVVPAEVRPRLGPDATGLGWIYQYYLEVDPAKAGDLAQDLGAQRALQDYEVRWALSAIPGVAEVASLGGLVRQYEVQVSSAKLKRAGLTIQDVMYALSQASVDVGGKVVEENGAEFVVRGAALVRGAEDIEKIVMRTMSQILVPLTDVARVKIGTDVQRGALDVNGQESVGGIVVLRNGENAHEVLRRVKAKVAELNGTLPAGVRIRSFYDRSDLIEQAIDTLRHALAEELILVTLVHIIFLWHFRSILIVTLPLPISILISFILMHQAGIPSHILSLTGIAISIGVLVDAGIVLTENVIRRCELAEREKGRRLEPQEIWDATRAGALQVVRPIFYSMLIVILAFLPVLVLAGQEGKLIRPLALAKTFALIGATLLAVTAVPVLCTWLVRGPFRGEHDNPIMRGLLRLYDPVLGWALDHPRWVLGGAAALLAFALFLAIGLPRTALESMRERGWHGLAAWTGGVGREFMPKLQEGSLLFMPVLVPKVAISEIKDAMAWQDRLFQSTPEVAIAAGKAGRAETATDPAPIEMIETTIILKPRSEWRPGMTVAKLIEDWSHRLMDLPGYVPGFLQPIENRVLMLSTGIRAEVAVKLLGHDLDLLQDQAFAIETIVREIDGATGVAASRLQGKPYIEIVPKRDALARTAVDARTVMEVTEVATGGMAVGETLHGPQRWPIVLRLDPHERQDMERLNRVLVPNRFREYVPLGEVAEVRRTLGPAEIQSENGKLRVYVQTNVENRDLAGFVAELRGKLEGRDWPSGVVWEIAGEFENQVRAERALQWIVPGVVALIFVLLVMVFRSVREAVHVLLAVPFALTGGLLFQYALGFPFSVAVWVGYLALFGTAIQTAVIMVLYLEEALERKKAERGAAFHRADLLQAVKDGARLRLRPKVMTVSTVIASLLPILWSTRTGAEIMKPLAAPVLGGMASSLLHILVVTPVIFYGMRLAELRDPGPRPGEVTSARSKARR